MKNFKLLSAFVALSLILISCGTSNNVVNNHSISKRKYTKGFFIKKKPNLKSKNSVANENIAIVDAEKTKTKPTNLGGKQINQTTLEVTSDELNRVSCNSDIAYTQTSGNVYVSPIDDSPYILRQDDELVYLDNQPEPSVQRFSEMSESEKHRANLREFEQNGAAGDSDLELILLVIIAIIIPPLAVFLYEGVTNRFWIDLILAILGYGIGFGVLGVSWGLLGLIAVIYALLIVLEAI